MFPIGFFNYQKLFSKFIAPVYMHMWYNSRQARLLKELFLYSIRKGIPYNLSNLTLSMGLSNIFYIFTIQIVQAVNWILPFLVTNPEVY